MKGHSMSIYHDYAKDVQIIKDATERNDKRKPTIMANIRKAKADSIVNEVGRFSIVDFTQYEYSTQVKELEAKLKDMKAKERDAGIATPKENPSLRFTSK
jgi:hypothetical protein